MGQISPPLPPGYILIIYLIIFVLAIYLSQSQLWRMNLKYIKLESWYIHFNTYTTINVVLTKLYNLQPLHIAHAVTKPITGNTP